MRKHRWRLWRVACWPLILVIPASLAIAVAVPGPHRLVCPQCYGLRDIGQRVFVDPTFTARDEASLRDAIAIGRRRAAKFFGANKGRPVIAACKTQRCLDTFGGGRAKAVAYGWYAIRMAPSGLNPTIATHELIHIELHWRLGAFGFWRPDIPAWFDEGLAVVLSEDKRFWRRTSERHVLAVMQAKTFSEWSTFTRKVGWRVSYGAAATAVRRLNRKVGRKGLRQLIDQVLAGENFEQLIKDTGVFEG